MKREKNIRFAILLMLICGIMPTVQAKSIFDSASQYASKAKTKASELYEGAKSGVKASTQQMDDWWDSLSSEEKAGLIAGAATTAAAGAASLGYALLGDGEVPEREQPVYTPPVTKAADPFDKETINSAKAINTRKDALVFFGLSPDASQTEIKKRYHKLSLGYHPDKHENEYKEWAEENFKAVNKAYSLLQ